MRAAAASSFAAVTTGGVLVHGTFGDLVIHADGSYTYTLNGEQSQGAGGNDVFTYQITDGDGDTSTATLTITVPPDSIPVANNATALVDDDGLPLGNHDSAPGDDTQNPDPDNNESTFAGTLTANFGTDGPGTFTWGADMDGKIVTIGQEAGDLPRGRQRADRGSLGRCAHRHGPVHRNAECATGPIRSTSSTTCCRSMTGRTPRITRLPRSPSPRTTAITTRAMAR